jgi:hypothetical protein
MEEISNYKIEMEVISIKILHGCQLGRVPRDLCGKILCLRLSPVRLTLA